MRLIALSFVATLAAAPFALADDSGWGAIAIDTEKVEREPYYGVGGGDTEQDAKDAALGFCTEAGGVTCQVMVTYQQCGALAVTGTGGGGWGTDSTKELAEAAALTGCKDATNCKVVVSDCNGG